LHLPVALDSSAHLFRTRRYQQRHGRLDVMRYRLRGDVGCTASTSDQSRGDFIHKAVTAVRDLVGKF
jgi:hypothetical protein